MTELANNLDWLSEEPVRELVIRGCQPGKDLELILRNYRMTFCFRVELHFRNPRDTTNVGRAIGQMEGSFLRELHLHHVDDRLKLIQVMFMANRRIAMNADLILRSYSRSTRVATHK